MEDNREQDLQLKEQILQDPDFDKTLANARRFLELQAQQRTYQAQQLPIEETASPLSSGRRMGRRGALRLIAGSMLGGAVLSQLPKFVGGDSSSQKTLLSSTTTPDNTLAAPQIAKPPEVPESPRSVISNAESRRPDSFIPQPAPQEVVKPICLGEFGVKQPSFYVPGSYKRVILKQVPESIEIKGFGSGEEFGYRYQFLDTQTGQILEVPIREVKILKGEPIPEKDIKTNPFFGIRVDDAELMGSAKKMGMGKVRIDAGGCNLSGPNQLEDRKLHAAIREAVKNNLELVLVVHPDHLLPKEEMQRRIDCLLSDNVAGNYNKIAIELGNEPDNKASGFWKDQNPETFSQFIKDATAAVKANPRGKGVKLILGALEGQGNTNLWLGQLKNSGINLNEYEIGLHAYQDLGDLQKRLLTLKDFLNRNLVKSSICITELGISDHDKRGLIEMLEFAKKSSGEFNISGLLIHELGDYEYGFGYIKPDSKVLYPWYFAIQRATQLIS